MGNASWALSRTICVQKQMDFVKLFSAFLKIPRKSGTMDVREKKPRSDLFANKKNTLFSALIKHDSSIIYNRLSSVQRYGRTTPLVYTIRVLESATEILFVQDVLSNLV